MVYKEGLEVKEIEFSVTVLVVSDNEVLDEFLRRLLSNSEGFIEVADQVTHLSGF